MTAILAIDSSTLTASVALLVDGELVAEAESGVNTHSDVLLSLIDQCLKAGGLGAKELDVIAVGAGPGSFTGLRIGMATAKGLCFANDIPLVPVSSLAAIALDCRRVCKDEGTLVPVMDARRREVFAGFYEPGDEGLRSLADEKVMAPAALLDHAKELDMPQPLLLCGDGIQKYKAILSPLGTIVEECRLTPSAHSVAELAQAQPAVDVLASAAPTYVRLAEAQIKFPDGNPGGTFSAASTGDKK